MNSTGEIKMKIIYIILITILLNQNFLYSNIQELERQLNTAQGKERVNILNQISTLLREIEPEKAIHFSDEAITLASTIDYSEGIAQAYTNFGVSKAVLGDNLEADESFKHALNLYNKLKDEYGIASSKNNLGRVYTKTGKYKDALVNLIQANELSKQNNYQDIFCKSSYHIGSLYDKFNDISQALKYYSISLEKAKENKNNDMIISILNNIGNVYYGISNYSKALQYYSDALNNYCSESDLSNREMLYNNIANIYFDLSKFDEAENYYNKSFNIVSQLNDSLSIGISYLNLANIYSKINKLSEAKDYYFKSIDIFKKAGADLDLADTYLYTGNFFLGMKDYHNAEKHLLISLNLYEKLGSLKGQRDAQSNLLSLYLNNKNIELSNKSLKMLNQLNDSLQFQDKNELINAIVAKTDAMIQIKDLNYKLAQEKSRFALLSTITVSIFALILICFITVIIAKKQAQKIKQKKEQLSELEVAMKNFHNLITTDVKDDWYLLGNAILNSGDSSNYKILCSTFDQVSHRLSNILEKYQPQIYFNNN
ncbi:MAG: tetratricopeptide repeat protein [Bacteroidetes bacterium]|nr:MAG: tetratricopeptide repeat protein [Bacteroidota bacterium]